MPEPKGAPELPESEADKFSKKPDDKASRKAPEKLANLDETVSEINQELEAMHPDLNPEDVVPVPDEDDTISLDDDSDTLLSDELVEEIESVESSSDDDTESPGAEQITFDENQDTAEAEDDPLTSEAVDDIVAEEGDTVLAAEDKARQANDEPEKPTKKPNKLVSFLKDVWHDPKKRWIAFSSTTALLLIVALVPTSRYFVLNTVGVRSSLQLTVTDGSTLQPLKNVIVRAGGSEGKTNSDGYVKLENVKLGRTMLQIEKRAFAPIDRPITVGWGSNPLGEFKVTAVGTQYTLFVKDFLSGKPIHGAEAASGDGNASSDEDGRIVLTLDTAELDDAAQISIEVSADNYRTETINITVNNKEQQSMELVPSRKHVYVSKRSGKYDVYTSYVDGKEEQRIVGGTGYERDDLALIPHPKAELAAYVATRENTRNPSGYLLSTLYVLDTQTGELTKIDQSEQIQVVGWSNSGRLVYVKIAAGASGNDPKRHRLMSFNANDFSDTKELASSNSFNDVMMIADRVYYAPSYIFQENPQPATFAVDPDGKNQKTILDKEIYTFVRTDYTTLYMSASDTWYTYATDSQAQAKLGTAPGSMSSRLYVDHPETKQSLWVDSRDGKGVLISYNTQSKEDIQLTSRSGLKLPVYWLNDSYAVFRVRDSRETADYVVNLNGGEPRKITDATDSAGITRWFYY